MNGESYLITHDVDKINDIKIGIIAITEFKNSYACVSLEFASQQKSLNPWYTNWPHEY